MGTWASLLKQGHAGLMEKSQKILEAQKQLRLAFENSEDVQVITNNPGQNDDGTVLENFSNISFDENSTNYLPRVIGDKFITIDSDGKLTSNGDYPNNSKYIRVSDIQSSESER